MWDFNPKTRVINITDLLVEYETILLELGILTRLNKRFENHKVIHKAPETLKEERGVLKHLSAELESVAYQDPVKLTNSLQSITNTNRRNKKTARYVRSVRSARKKIKTIKTRH